MATRRKKRSFQTDTSFFEEAVREISRECDELLVKKQRDYGPKNFLTSPFGAEVSVIVKLHDKISRLVNLYQKGKPPENESVRDSWKDIRNYGEIGMMILDKKFGLPLKKE